MKHLKILIAILLFNSLAYSQKEYIKFKKLTSRQGLSEETIMCMTQDKEGFVWFGTNDGLNRYDGYNFTVFRNSIKDTNTLSNNAIRAIYEEENGTLWIGTYDGLNKYTRSSASFTRYRIPPDIKGYTVASNRIKQIFKDKDGIFWLGTANGLFVFDKAKASFKRYPNLGTNTKPVLNYIYSIFEDKQGNLWVGTDGEGLVLIDKKSGGYKSWTNIPGDTTSISDNDVFCFYEYSDNILMLGTYGGGLNVFDKQTGKFFSYQNQTDKPNSISGNAIMSMSKDGDYLWLGTYNGGLNRFALTEAGKDGKSIEHFEHFYSKNDNEYSINSNSIRTLYKDHLGIIWIGNFGKGLNMYTPNKTKFKHYKSKLSSDVIATIEDKNKVLWIATTKGLERFDKKTAKHKYYHSEQGKPNSLISDNISAMYLDKKGLLWIGTQAGLCSFNKEKGLFTHYKHKPDDSTSLSYNIVKAIYEDNAGFIWVGTNEGLNKLDKRTGKFVRYTRYNSNLKSHEIKCIFCEKSGALWIGTDAGLHRINPGTDNFEVFQHDVYDTTSISNNFITSTFEDNLGHLWIGTMNGLNYFNKKNKTFIQYYEEDGLPNNIINGILEDKHKNLWISTNNGLSKFNPKFKTFRNYTVNDGLQAKKFYNSAYKSVLGKMYFSGPNGYNAFHPNKIKDLAYLPPVEIVDFKIFDKSVRIGEKQKSGTSLKKNIVDTDEITLSYKDYVFSFEFAALDFSAPEDIKYAFKMDGFDTKWRHTTANQRFATYTNLPHGIYTFKLKATNSDGIWVEKETRLKIIIRPPFWNTWWFRIIAFLFIASSLYLWYRLRVKNIQKQKNRLALQVKERTIEIAQQNKKLKKAYEDVKQLSEIGTEITSLLSVETIIDIVYANVNQLMDASVFGIGIYDKKAEKIFFKGTKEKGITLPSYSYDLNDTSRLAVRCFVNQEEISIRDFKNEYVQYVSQISKPRAGDITASVVYIPINIKKKKIGVITIQSFEKDAYQKYHLDILRNIGIYTAIAVDNAEAYKLIELHIEKLKAINLQLKESDEETQLLNEELSSANEQLLKQRQQLEEAINKLKHTQSQLIQSEKLASVGILTAGIAHEINNPLNFIQGGKVAIENYANEYLKEHVDKLSTFINFINEGLERTTAIVNSLNRFNRKNDQQDEKCDIALIIENCLTMLQHTLKHRVEVKTQYTNTPYLLLGNEGELHQVFLNILSNAAQAIVGKGKISVTTQIANSKLSIIISDTGYGISSENMKKITDPFFTTKSPGKGTGLGMSIAFSIIEKHSGTINYKSQIGQGTTVTITFPVSTP